MVDQLKFSTEIRSMKPDEAQLVRLIRLVKADGVLDAQEIKLLLEMAERKGFSKDELGKLADREASAIPEFAPDKVRYFYQAVALALSDGVIAENELNVLRSIGKQLKLEAQSIEIVLERLRNEHDSGLSYEQMEDLFK